MTPTPTSTTPWRNISWLKYRRVQILRLIIANSYRLIAEFHVNEAYSSPSTNYKIEALESQIHNLKHELSEIERVLNVS